MTVPRTRVKINFVDFWHGNTVAEVQENNLYKLLAMRFDLELSDDPDFLIYSCLGRDFLRYRCMRIFYTGENIRPNFSECDYAFSFDFSDDPRNYRLPIYRLDDSYNALFAAKDVEIILEEKSRFCNFIYLNHRPRARKEFFHLLSAYKQIDAPGPVLNNMAGLADGSYAAKLAFIRPYKFTIAFENSSYPGYTTEKLLHAMVANTIPIYWGNPRVAEDFNPASFINCHEYESFEAVVDRVIELDQDQEKYRAMLAQPFFLDNRPNKFVDTDNILARFDMIFRQSQTMPVGRTWRRHMAAANHNAVYRRSRKLLRRAMQRMGTA